MITSVRFPDEILCNVFSYGSIKDLCRLSRVCKRFKQVAESDLLWKNFYKHIPAKALMERGRLKELTRRVYPIRRLVEECYLVSSLFSTCLMGRDSVYDPTTNRLVVSFANHENTMCVCPARFEEDCVGAVYDLHTNKRLYNLLGMVQYPPLLHLDTASHKLITLSIKKITALDLKTRKEKISYLKELPLGREIIRERSTRICVGRNVIDYTTGNALVRFAWPENIYAYDHKNKWAVTYFNYCVSIYKVNQSGSQLHLKIPGIFYFRTEPFRTFCYVLQTQQLICILEKSPTLVILDLMTKQQQYLDVGPASVTSLFQACNLLIVALNDRDNKRQSQIKVFELTSLKCLIIHPKQQDVVISHIAYDPETRVLLTGSNSQMDLLDIDTGFCLRSIPNPARQPMTKMVWDTKAKTIEAHWCFPYDDWKFRLIRY